MKIRTNIKYTLATPRKIRQMNKTNHAVEKKGKKL